MLSKQDDTRIDTILTGRCFYCPGMDNDRIEKAQDNSEQCFDKPLIQGYTTRD